jgi:hypothetical protein
MCVARDLYDLWGRSPYTRMFVARTFFWLTQTFIISFWVG